MTLDLIINGVVAVLLIATIGVATLLYVRLERIRRSRGEMEALVAQLATAGAAAEASLRGFREIADGAGRDLETRIGTGQSLRDELAFLVDRASAIADRLASLPAATPNEPRAAQAARPSALVQAIRPRGRGARNTASSAQRASAAPDAGIAQPMGDAEQALMRALESAR